MKFDQVSAYGAAGGESRRGTIRLFVEASECDTVAEAKDLVAAAPALLAACEAVYEHMAEMGCECPTETTGHYSHCVLGMVEKAIDVSKGLV